MKCSQILVIFLTFLSPILFAEDNKTLRELKEVDANYNLMKHAHSVDSSVVELQVSNGGRFSSHAYNDEFIDRVLNQSAYSKSQKIAILRTKLRSEILVAQIVESKNNHLAPSKLRSPGDNWLPANPPIPPTDPENPIIPIIPYGVTLPTNPPNPEGPMPALNPEGPIPALNMQFRFPLDENPPPPPPSE